MNWVSIHEGNQPFNKHQALISSKQEAETQHSASHYLFIWVKLRTLSSHSYCPVQSNTGLSTSEDICNSFTDTQTTTAMSSKKDPKSSGSPQTFPVTKPSFWGPGWLCQGSNSAHGHTKELWWRVRHRYNHYKCWNTNFTQFKSLTRRLQQNEFMSEFMRSW